MTVTVAETTEASTVFVVPIDARTIREPVPVIMVTGSAAPSVVDGYVGDGEGVIGDDISTVLVVPVGSGTIFEPIPVMTVTGSTVFKVMPWLI